MRSWWITAFAFASSALATGGCALDPCAAYAGQGCIVLEVRAGTSGLSSVDQLRIGSAELQIAEQSTPTAPQLAALPVQVPVLAGAFAGTYSISVQAVKAGATVGVGSLSGGSLRAGEHRLVALDLAAPGVSSDFAVVQALPVGESLISIWGADPAHIYAVGSNGLRMDYYEGSWHRTQNHLGWDYNQVWGTSANNIFAVGTVLSDNSGFVEHFDGTAWRAEYMPKAGLMGVWASVPEVVYAVAADGMIYARGPNGVWDARLSKPLLASPLAAPGAPVLWSISGNGPNDFAMAAGLDRVFHYEGGGNFVNLDPDQDRTVEFRSTCAAPGPDTSVFFGSNYFGTYWLTSNPPPGPRKSASISIGSASTSASPAPSPCSCRASGASIRTCSSSVTAAASVTSTSAPTSCRRCPRPRRRASSQPGAARRRTSGSSASASSSCTERSSERAACRGPHRTRRWARGRAGR